MAYGPYLNGQGTIDYETGKLSFTLNKALDDDVKLYLSYFQETPCFCEYVNSNDMIKIAFESLKAW